MLNKVYEDSIYLAYQEDDTIKVSYHIFEGKNDSDSAR
jgi:hypothetical protein